MGNQADLGGAPKWYFPFFGNAKSKFWELRGELATLVLSGVTSLVRKLLTGASGVTSPAVVRLS